MNASLSQLAEKVLGGHQITMDESRFLARLEGDELYDLFYWANRIRQNFLGRGIGLCAIISARQGRCSEDCKFCAQSAWYSTEIEEYPLIEKDALQAALKRVWATGASALGIVTSGRELSQGELEALCQRLRGIDGPGDLHVHASIGLLSPEGARRLRASGVRRFNHNLETSRAYFPRLCTTHSYQDRLASLKAAKEAGLELCSGGIFGVGESEEDRLELAFTLRNLDVDTVPLNFLHPIPGTPLGQSQPLVPMEILRIIALYRFILPAKEIKVAGGRQKNLRDMQSWAFYAGASSIIVGDYLVTRGRLPEEDLQMIRDLGLHPKDLMGNPCL